MTGKVLDTLIAARSFLSDRRRWTQRTSARDSGGRRVNVTDGAATCFCLTGYLDRHLPWGSEKIEIMAALAKAAIDLDYFEVDSLYNPEGVVVGVNDLRGHDAVLAILDRAIATMKEGDSHG